MKIYKPSYAHKGGIVWSKPSKISKPWDKSSLRKEKKSATQGEKNPSAWNKQKWGWKKKCSGGLTENAYAERCLDGLAENAYAKRRKIEMQRFTLAAFRSLLSAINSRKIVLILGCYRIGFKVKTDIVYPKSELE